MSQERIPAIIGLGAARGEQIITNPMISNELGKPEKFTDRAMRISGAGIESRHRVAEGTRTSDLGVRALEQALEMAHVDKSSLKTIVVGSSTPDYQTVSVAAIIQDKLGIPTNVRVYDVSAACPGFTQALYNTFADLTSSLGRGGPQAALGAEVTSMGMSVNKPNTYILFGDGAGAVVADLVEPDPGAPTKMGFSFGGDGSKAEDLYVPGGGNVYRTTHETVDQDLHALTMNSDVIGHLAPIEMAKHARLALAEAGVSAEDVTLLIPHQANLSIMRNTADELGIPQSKVIEAIRGDGNTSSASIPLAMEYAWESGRLNRNDMLAFAAFGAGLVVGAGVIPMVGLPRR